MFVAIALVVCALLLGVIALYLFMSRKRFQNRLFSLTKTFDKIGEILSSAIERDKPIGEIEVFGPDIPLVFWIALSHIMDDYWRLKAERAKLQGKLDSATKMISDLKKERAAAMADVKQPAQS